MFSRSTLIALLFALACLCIPASAQNTSVVINSPWAEIVWTDGTNATIAWTVGNYSIANPITSYTIELLNGPSENATVLYVIASAVAASETTYGPFLVNFGQTGINFFVRVRALLQAGGSADGYSARFTIAQNPSASASATIQPTTVLETTTIIVTTTVEATTTTNVATTAAVSTTVKSGTSAKLVGLFGILVAMLL